MTRLIWLLLFLPQLSLAAADITAVTGASVFNDDTTTPEILGGVGGTDCSADVTSSETCDSCQADTLAVCNTTRVYSSLQLRIEFVDDKSSGRTRVVETVDSQAIDLVDSESTDDQTVSAGNTHVAVMTWSTLCSEFTEDSTCATSFSKTIRIGASENGSDFSGTTQDVTIKLVNPTEAGNTVTDCDSATRGLCNFTAYPGDEKIYLEDLESKGNFPSDSNAQFKYFRVIFSTVSFDESELNPKEAIDAGNYKDIAI